MWIEDDWFVCRICGSGVRVMMELVIVLIMVGLWLVKRIDVLVFFFVISFWDSYCMLLVFSCVLGLLSIISFCGWISVVARVR